MKILITGGTGFVGRHFIHTYPQHDYTVLTRTPSRAKALLGNEHTYISSLEPLAQLDEFSAIVNLCGEPIVDKRWSDAQKERIQNSRWHITSELVKLIGQSTTPPKVFISGSAIGFYGSHGAQACDEETDPVQQDFAQQVCAKWEQIALQSQAHTRVCLLRTGIVLGPRGGALAKMATPFKFGLGAQLGDGKQIMSWVHIDDMVSAMDFLIQHNTLQGAFNITAPEAVSNREFSQTLAATFGRSLYFRAPATVLRLALGEASTMLLDGRRVWPKRLQDAGFQFGFPKLPEALQNIYRAS